MYKKTVLCVALMLGVFLGFHFPSFLKGDAKNVPGIPQEFASYRDIVKKILPAVVSVEATTTVQTNKKSSSPRRPFEVPWPPDDFRKFFEEFQDPFDFSQEFPPMHGFASGFVIDPAGVILTNYHVVKGAEKVTVEFQDGRKFVAREIRSDPKTDLAVLLIEATNLPCLMLGESDRAEIGDRVLAVGAPFGLVGSVTSGIVSGKGRNLNMAMYEDYIQTDAAINPGNSGGPLINLEGKVVGVNTAIKSRSGSWQGVGLAIPSDLVKKVWPQLQRDGKVRRGYLGIQVRKLDSQVAASLGLPNQSGIIVSKVFENTPASKAGLKDGDVLTSIAGKDVKDVQQVQRTVTELQPGNSVKLAIFRDGKSMIMTAALEEQPTEFGLPTPQPLQHNKVDGISLEGLGIRVADLTPDRARQFGHMKAAEGAAITYVDPGSLAAEAGVERGSLILKVDNKPVQNAEAAREMVGKGSLERGILLQIKSPNDGISFVLLKSSGNR